MRHHSGRHPGVRLTHILNISKNPAILVPVARLLAAALVHSALERVASGQSWWRLWRNSLSVALLVWRLSELEPPSVRSKMRSVLVVRQQTGLAVALVQYARAPYINVQSVSGRRSDWQPKLTSRAVLSFLRQLQCCCCRFWCCFRSALRGPGARSFRAALFVFAVRSLV